MTDPTNAPAGIGGIDGTSAPVGALVALVDPDTLSVTWANESVYASVAERGGTPDQVGLLDEAIPMATAVDLGALVREVYETGVPAHRTATIVSTVRGSATLVMSVYRLPDEWVLVVAENSWSAERRSPRGVDRARPRRHR